MVQTRSRSRSEGVSSAVAGRRENQPSPSARRIANNKAVQKHLEANRDSVNRKKVLNNVRTKGYVPQVKTFIKYGITYEEFATHRARNEELAPLEAEDLFAMRFLHATADDFFKVFNVEKPDLKIQVKIKTPTNPPPAQQEIDPVETVEIPPDVITYKMAEDAFERLTPNNARSYSSNLRRLMKELGVNPTSDYKKKATQVLWHDIDIVKMITKKGPKAIADMINSSTIADTSKKDIYGSIQNLLKWVPGFRDKLVAEGVDLPGFRGERNTYSTLSQKTRDVAVSTKTVIPFTMFLNRRRDLAKKQPHSIEHLISSLHTYIPSRRGNEFGTVRIIYNDKSKPMSPDENAYDVRTGFMQIAKYKGTAAKKLGAYTKVLPDVLQEVINGYLKKEKQPTYLYGTGKPMSAEKATDLFRRTFKGVLGKKDGVSELRRSTRTYYVRNMKYNLEQQRQLAFDMGHSLEQSLNYERQYDDPAFDEVDDNPTSDPQVKKIPPRVNKKRNLKKRK